MRRALLLALSCAIPPPAAAHDLWIDRDGPLYTLAYGHARSGHEGARRLEYRPETLQQAACFAASGQASPAELGRQFPVTLRGDCAAVWFQRSSGYWSKTPYGTRNLPRTEAGAVLDSWLSIESVKRIDRWHEALARPLTRELELVALADPLQAKPGGKLRLRAWRQGKPAAGASVVYFGKSRGLTGADGTIDIRLGEAGLQRIRATLELPLDDGKAERAVLATTLQFETR